MRKRLRLQMLVPVAALALVVLGVAAFAYTSGPAGEESTSPKSAPAAAPAGKTPQAAPTPKKRTALEKALLKHSVVVVVLYTPDSALDSLAAREARAGALAVGAGFVAVNVANERAVSQVAAAFGVREAPAMLVISRDTGLLTQIDGFADRDTVAQAAEIAQLNAL